MSVQLILNSRVASKLGGSVFLPCYNHKVFSIFRACTDNRIINSTSPFGETIKHLVFKPFHIKTVSDPFFFFNEYLIVFTQVRRIKPWFPGMLGQGRFELNYDGVAVLNIHYTKLIMKNILFIQETCSSLIFKVPEAGTCFSTVSSPVSIATVNIVAWGDSYRTLGRNPRQQDLSCKQPWVFLVVSWTRCFKLVKRLVCSRVSPAPEFLCYEYIL